MPTVASLKGSTQTWQPLLLVSFSFQGASSPLLLSTHPLDGVAGPVFPGVVGGAPAGAYIGRVAQQDIEALQHRSQSGIDRVPKITVHIWDGDFTIYSDYAKVYGFRGATLQVWLTMWQVGTGNFASDSPLLFSGTCDMEVPQQGMTILAVSANSGHNTATVKLPIFPIQNRCPKVFPPDAASRAAALNDPSSIYYPCGYSADQPGGVGNKYVGVNPHTDSFGNQVTDANGYYIMCDYLRSDSTRTDQSVGCMARLGNYATTSVAPDGDLMHDQSGAMTGRFAGLQWSPGTYYAWDITYTNNGKTATFSFANSAVWGDFHSIVYGHQMLNCKVANVVESGNDTKCEVLICAADIGTSGVDLVLVNGVQLDEAPSGDPNLYWSFANDGVNYSTGGRNGIAIKNVPGYCDANHTALGDPYGSIARILVNVYKDIFTGPGTPTVQVRCYGPLLWVWADIASVTGDGTHLTINLGSNTPNYYSAGPGTYQIVGNSLSGANGLYTSAFSSFTQGPPGTIVLNSSTVGGGTGGYVGFLPQSQHAGYVVTGASWSLGVATVIIGSHSIQVGQIVSVTNISSTGGIPGAFNRVNIAVTSVTSTSISYYLPINPGTYASGGYVVTGATNSNPAWVLLDILIKSNWKMSEVNLQSFIDSAYWCDTPIAYQDKSGKTAYHERYKCAFALEQRRSAAEIIAAVLRSFNAYLYYDQSGLLSLGILQTLADSQPSPITGSNYNTGISSIHADQSVGTGYAAYAFDDSNINVIGTGDNMHLDVEWLDNATVNTPNQIVITFQDEDNQWVQDSLSQISTAAVNRAGGSLQPGGALVPDTPSILGITNYDQAIRIANVMMAERQFGNEANDARGTRTCVIGTTVDVEHLHTGHLVILSLANIGLSKQLFRVMKIQPSTDFETAKVTLQWENEIWRTDTYGQAPQAFYSNPASSKPNRVPAVWQPFAEVPSVPSADDTSGFPLITNTEYTFHLAEIDQVDASGNPLIQAQIGGNFPINQIAAAVQPPRLIGGGFSSTGGSITGGQSYLVAVCAIDANGVYSGASGFLRIPVPTGTNTNTITVGLTNWTSGTSGYDIFVGKDSWSLTSQLQTSLSLSGNITASATSIIVSATSVANNDILRIDSEQLKVTAGGGTTTLTVTRGWNGTTKAAHNNTAAVFDLTANGTPAAITLSSLPNTRTYSIPDTLAAQMEVNIKSIIHAGIIGESVVSVTSSPHTITIGAPASGTLSNTLTGYRILLVGRQDNSGNDLPEVIFSISSYTVNGDLSVTFTVDRDPTALIQVGDAIVICAQANVNSPTTIGDTNFTSVYAPTGVDSSDSGNVVRIVAGTGRYQTRTITGVSSTGGVGNDTYTVDSVWSTQPDSTSMFIVEEPNWKFHSPITPKAVQVLNDQTLAQVDVSNLAESAILVQPLIVDGTGTITSSERRSPIRILWLFGAQGTRIIIPTSSAMRSTDRVLKFDTSSVTGTTTTLNGSINAIQTNITLNAAYGQPNGTIFSIGTETMYVQSGSGTTSLVVVRAWNGDHTTGSAHTNGDTVNVPGFLDWPLISFSDVPNQSFLFSKISSDINWVKIRPAGTDQLPDGELFHILADSSAAYGTYGFVVPSE